MNITIYLEFYRSLPNTRHATQTHRNERRESIIFAHNFNLFALVYDGNSDDHLWKEKLWKILFKLLTLPRINKLLSMGLMNQLFSLL